MRTLVRLVPIAFIPFLVPPGSSADKTRYDIGDIAHDIEKAPGPEKAPAPAVELTPNSAQLDDVDLEGKRPVVEAPAAEGDDRAGGATPSGGGRPRACSGRCRRACTSGSRRARSGRQTRRDSGRATTTTSSSCGRE